MALKLPWYFYLLMEMPLGRYFQVESPYYQAAQCNQKTPIDRSGVRKPKKKKKIAINTNHSYHPTTSVHLTKPVSTDDLTIKPDFVSTNPIGKDGVRSWSM